VESASIGSLGFWAIAAAMTGLALAFVLPRLAARRQVSAAVAVGVALPVVAFALYVFFGDPAASRSEATAVAPVEQSAADDPQALRAKLAAHLERSPRDGRAWVLLARIDFENDRFADAAAAYAKALGVSDKVARDPNVWCEYADALGMDQGGSLAGKPRELIAHALTLDSAHPKALEMAGSAAFEANDPAQAATYWRELLANLPPASLQRRELALAVARAEQLAAAGNTAMDTTK
jgi:cytochrome c-type biogenesis protein CcmH